MLNANKIEQELITKFIEKARRAVPQIRIRYAEKFADSEDTYLRLSLVLPKEVDITDPGDFEILQRLASAMPAHPKVHLSLTYIDLLDEEHEVSLEFLPPETISGKQYEKRSVLSRIFAEHLAQEYFFKRWYLVLIFLAGAASMWLYASFIAKPLDLMGITAESFRRGARYANFDVRTADLQKEARSIAGELEQALSKYASAVPEEDTGFVYKDEKQRHLLGLKRILENDPIIGPSR